MVNDERGIQNAGCRRVTIIECRQINERFEGRAGLPFGLGYPVEMAIADIPAAGECKHATGLRIHCDETSLDVGDLAQGEGIWRIFLAIAVLGHCFDKNHIARCEDIGTSLYPVAETLLFTPLPRPAARPMG